MFWHLGGVTAYCAYNVRTIYLFAFVYLMIEFIVKVFQHKAFKTNFYIMISFVLGITVGMLPQLLINYRQYQTISFFVPTNNLFIRQLEWGLRLQRYDTVISEELKQSGMRFIDTVGYSILQNEKMSGCATYEQYIRLLLKYPFEMIGIYVRHLANMLFPVYPENFIYDIGKSKICNTVLSFSIIFLFGIVQCFGVMKNKVLHNFIPMLLPVIFIIPGSVEQRYGIAVFYYMISSICYNVDWEKFKQNVQVNFLKVVIVYLIFGGLLLAIWTSCLSSLTLGDVTQIKVDYPLFIE